MKIALLSYTNVTSGVGVIAHGLFKWLPTDSILSIASSKGHSTWCPRQSDVSSPRPPLFQKFLRQFKPDVLLSVETMFDNGHFVHDVCTEHHVRTATIIMHESYNPGQTRVGLYICPTWICLSRVKEKNKALFELPFEIEQFPFKPRTQARRFLHVMGFGAAHNRRQTREVVAGFLEANLPHATLTVHCCQDWRAEYGRREDPRVTYRRQIMPEQRSVYAGFDVLVQPESYAGFCLPILEAQACGMPVITTNAAPMNEHISDFDALIPVAQVQRLETRGTSPTRVNLDQQLVTAEGVAAAITRIDNSDVHGKSVKARLHAETRAWSAAKAEELRTLLKYIPK